MKKLLIFVLIAGAAFSASAQRNYHDNNNSGYSRNNDRGEYSRHSAIDRRIQSINIEYDARIDQVQQQGGLRPRAKNRRIAKLEHERFAAIERCKTFAVAHDRDYADRHDRYDRRK